MVDYDKRCGGTGRRCVRSGGGGISGVGYGVVG